MIAQRKKCKVIKSSDVYLRSKSNRVSLQMQYSDHVSYFNANIISEKHKQKTKAKRKLHLVEVNSNYWWGTNEIREGSKQQER